MAERTPHMKRPGRYITCIITLAIIALLVGSAGAQELVIGVPQDQYRLEGDRADLGVYPLNTNITETLVTLTPDFEVVPGLAERWENVRGSTWRFFLRRGVRFHDGTELTAEAVKASLDRAARAGGSIPLDETSTQVVDSYTVDITPTLPFFNRVVDNLVHPLYGIYAPGSDPASHPLGTGPFKFGAYQRSQQLVVVRNDDYWGESAKVAELTFRFIPDGSTRALALQAGDVDLVTTVPKEMIRFMTSVPGLKVYESEPASYVALYLVTKTDGTNDLLKDVRLRKALNLAINREEIVNAVWGGYALPAKTLIPPGVFGGVDERVAGYAFDPEQARNLIAEAGWTYDEGANRWTKGERELTLRLVAGFPPAPLIAPLPEVLKGQLAAVGIQVELLELNDVGAFYDEMAAGTSEIFIEQGSYNTADPSFIPYNLFWSANTWGEAGEYYHWFFVNDRYDTAVKRAISTSVQTDAVDAMVEAMQIQVDDYAGVVPIAYVPQIHIAQEDVQGVTVHPSGVNQTWTSVTTDGP